MTGNAQIDHRKYFKLFYIDHRAGGQFESLQGVSVQVQIRGNIFTGIHVCQIFQGGKVHSLTVLRLRL